MSDTLSLKPGPKAQTHDEERASRTRAVNDAAEKFAINPLDLHQALREIDLVCDPFKTHKAKEEGKAELLKQMMEEADRYLYVTGSIVRVSNGAPQKFIRRFATERGINIEKGER